MAIDLLIYTMVLSLFIMIFGSLIALYILPIYAINVFSISGSVLVVSFITIILKG